MKRWILIACLSLVVILILSVFVVRRVQSNLNSEHFNLATAYLNKAKTTSANINDQTEEVYAKLTVDLLGKTLEEAKKVDIDILNRHYSTFGDHFRDEFIPSVELLLDAMTTPEAGDDVMNRGIELDSAWNEWYNSHRHEL